jgi:PPP family 3-phenylpropionic acid transporter
MGFYYSFFPVYYEQMGASRTLIGISMFVSACSETPFLLYASRLFNKIKAKYIMLGSAAAMGLRWYLLHIITNIYAVLPTMLLHGLNFIVLSYAMATYVNKNIPKELKASGQAVNWVIALGLSRIFGSVAGGYFVDIFGIRQVFLYNSILVGVFIILFDTIFILQDKKHSFDSPQQTIN